MIDPIFVDSNTGPKDYPDENALRVSTIFKTLQGEGPFSGRPCVFLRLAGCNWGAKGVRGVGCDFCDTDFRMSESELWSFQELDDHIFGVLGCDLLVVTGGEPSLQREQLVGFLDYTMRPDKHGGVIPTVQIESNGVRYIDVKDKSYEDQVHVVLSPKFPTRTHRDKLGHIANGYIAGRRNQQYLKFVVTADPEHPHHTVPEGFNRLNFPHDRTYVSPMAIYKEPPTEFEGVINIWADDCPIDKEATRANYKHAAGICMEHGYKLSIQTHLFAELP